MAKGFFKKFLVIFLSWIMFVGTAATCVPMAVRAAGTVTLDELQRTGWTKYSDTLSEWKKYENKKINSKATIYVKLPDFLCNNEPADGFKISLDNTAKNFIDSANVDMREGAVVISPMSFYGDYAGQTGQITVERGDIKITDSAESIDAYFYYHIRLQVPAPADSASIDQGWDTSDDGQTYTQRLDVYQVGEGSQGRTISISIPRLSTTGVFENGDMVTDSSIWRIIKDVNINSSRSTISITFVNDLTDESGRTVTIRLRKNIYNASNTYANYTLSIPIKISSLTDAKVNGYKAPATIRVQQGEQDAVRVTNVSNLNKAVVHWTTDSTGYDDVSNQNAYPQVSSNGYIDTSRMTPGTYYFYIRVNNDLETRIFTLVISGNNNSQFIPSPTQGTIYRLLNPNSNEHLFTTDANEVNILRLRGWRTETALGLSGGNVAVFRLYNPYSGEHLYSSDTNECRVLQSRGWRVDNKGVAMFYGNSEGIKPVYRLYNRYQSQVSSHHYTSDMNEVWTLVSRGWEYDNNRTPVFYLQ